MNNCPLCAKDLENVIVDNQHARILFVVENAYPILRVVAKKHVKEMTDLEVDERNALMQMVFACEVVLRQFLKADKINLASLGNVVPHLHWHIIARFENDAHFPDSIWAKPRREPLMPKAAKVDRAALQCALYKLLND